MKGDFGERDSINVRLSNPREGVDFKRLSMALNLVFSEKDLLNYLKGEFKGKAKIPYPISSQNEVLA
jgi:F420-0:gamma-glutamyl ligase-like protein